MAKFYPSAEKLTASMVSTLEHLQHLEALQLNAEIPSDPWPTSATPASSLLCSSNWNQIAVDRAPHATGSLEISVDDLNEFFSLALALKPEDNWDGSKKVTAAMRCLASLDQNGKP